MAKAELTVKMTNTTKNILFSSIKPKDPQIHCFVRLQPVTPNFSLVNLLVLINHIYDSVIFLFYIFFFKLQQ